MNTLQDYVAHYCELSTMLRFLGVAVAGALVCLFIILIVAKLSTLGPTKQVRKVRFYERAFNLAQRFDEMIFSATSILSFLAVYYLIDRFAVDPGFRSFWDKWSDFILLAMICFSCVINSYFDVMLVPLKKISKDDKASVRLTGMFYIMIIFLYIKFIYENNNYDGFIMYFLGLMIGRFIYFDASFKDFLNAIKMALKNIALLILGLAYTAAMCLYGFGTDYLLVHNGVLVSTFIAHLFMVVAIFIVHHLHIINIFVRKPKVFADDEYNEADYFEQEYSDDYQDSSDPYGEEYGEQYSDEYEEDDEDEDEDDDEDDRYAQVDRHQKNIRNGPYPRQNNSAPEVYSGYLGYDDEI